MIFRGVLAVVAVGALLVAATEADACTCASVGCGVFAADASLFEATVLEIEPGDGTGQRRVWLSDVRQVGGAAAPPFVVSGGPASCDYQFEAGVRYLVEARPGPLGYIASICSHTRPLVAARGLLRLLAAPAGARPRIFGRVAADGDGRTPSPPVGGAIVTLDGPVRARTTTNASGDFSIMAVPNGAYRVTVEMPAGRSDVEPPAPQKLTLDAAARCAEIAIVAPSPARVAGSVVDRNGAPLAGVFVELFPVPYDQWAGGMVHGAVTDQDGRYSVPHLPPGRYIGGVGVPLPTARNPFAPALARGGTGTHDIDVRPGAVVELAPIVTRPAPLVAVSGRVSAAPGADVSALMLVLRALDGLARGRGYGGTTRADGRFTITAHEGVRYRVLVERGDVVLGSAEFVAGAGPLEIRLTRR
jgi:hypothetical protein